MACASGSGRWPSTSRRRRRVERGFHPRLIGPVLGSLGVVPLAAHFFIFYFGMMSMVTPPVALAAYTAASIAGAAASSISVRRIAEALTRPK